MLRKTSPISQKSRFGLGRGGEAAQISSEQTHFHSYLIFKVDQGLKISQTIDAYGTQLYSERRLVEI